MIISPPFLPVRGAAQAEDAWLDAAMPPVPSRMASTAAPEGSFPLSHRLAWHNGMHLQAPANLPARAVADGTVVFVNPPTPHDPSVTHAQNYNAFDRAGSPPTAAWTDNGCVVIEHRTTIGAQGATDTELVYYSLYMHLSALGKTARGGGQAGQRDWQAGDTIWRKDEVGTPGRVYGDAGQMHFEIALDAANLQLLLGRAPAWVAPPAGAAGHPAPSADGRTDSVFGSLYFYLPASTPTDTGAALPAQHLRRAGGSTLGTALWVKMSYRDGACQFTSYDTSGTLVRELPAVADEEYNLYEQANDRHGALPAAQRAHSSPSGWYELLRFGRNLGNGTTTDPLPADAAHWRRIPGPAGTPVWADLNAAGSFKFSDADFPAVAGWNFIDDDSSPNDQRCDSLHIKELIRDPDPNNANRMQDDELARRLGDAGVRAKLRRLVCRFPSEWDRATVVPRYTFVQSLPPFVREPNEWPRFVAHMQAMSFAGMPAGYLGATWHVHPREFIGFMRQCGWLSQTEAVQVLPRSFIAEHHGTRTIYRGSITRAQARARIGGMLRELNRTMRKYLIDTRQRQAVFLANAIVESSYLGQFYEGGRGAGARYGIWYGRGIIQITWQDNYLAYFRYLGRSTANATTNAQWRDDVETDADARCDTAGFWWIRNSANRHATTVAANQNWPVTVCENFNWQRRACVGARTAETHLSNPTLDTVGRLVNTGAVTTTGRVNGLVERRDIFTHVQAVLMEHHYPDAAGAATLMWPQFFSPQR